MTVVGTLSMIVDRISDQLSRRLTVAPWGLPTTLVRLQPIVVTGHDYA